MSELEVQELLKNIFYIQNAIPEPEKIVAELEREDRDDGSEKIIPNYWKEWRHGTPEIQLDKEGNQVKIIGTNYREDDSGYAGAQKLIDWNYSKISVDLNEFDRDNDDNLDSNQLKAYEIIKLIDVPYKKALKAWSEASGVPYPSNWVSKNYTIKKYRDGGDIGEHEDKNIENPDETMDWTALIYLTDEYEGGEVLFHDLEERLTIKPSAGSILFFPCDAIHSANVAHSGIKMFIFMYIHSGMGISRSLNEDYILVNAKFLKG